MKKVITVITLALMLFGPAYANKSGKGELKLSKKIMTWVMMYMYGAGNPKYSGDEKKKNNPMVMAISENGRYSYYYYCAYPSCTDGNEPFKAIKRCEKRSGGNPCYIFAKKRKIVWDNGSPRKERKIKRTLLKDPYSVAKKLQDLGFYDGDISELPGINYETGQKE